MAAGASEAAAAAVRALSALCGAAPRGVAVAPGLPSSSGSSVLDHFPLAQVCSRVWSSRGKKELATG